MCIQNLKHIFMILIFILRELSHYTDFQQATCSSVFNFIILHYVSWHTLKREHDENIVTDLRLMFHNAACYSAPQHPLIRSDLTYWGRDKWTPFRRRHFQVHILNEHGWISIKISLKFVPKGRINNIPALVQIMAWRRPGDKPLSEPMMVTLPTHICVTRPQWVKKRTFNVRQSIQINSLAGFLFLTNLNAISSWISFYAINKEYPLYKPDYDLPFNNHWAFFTLTRLLTQICVARG